MKKRLLMGNEAIALGALRAGVSVVTGYPGTPSTEILETIVRELAVCGANCGANCGGGESIHVEWSVNEKAALEVAAGAACAGARALVTMKQVGLNVASDPLMSLNYLGVAGALVVVVADDPGPISSQTEQDTRRFGLFAKIAVFDPSTPEEAYLMIGRAFAHSEKYGRPVILRPTTRVCHSYASVELLEDLPRRESAGFDKAAGRWVIFPSLAYRNHLQIEGDLERMAEDVASDPGNALIDSGSASREQASGSHSFLKRGIAAGGVSWAYLREILGGLGTEAPCRLLKVAAYPLAQGPALDFLRGLDEVLVIEELDPVIERELILLCGRHNLPVKVRGKLSGDMIRAGEHTLALLEPKIREFLGRSPASPLPAGGNPPPPPELPVRPPVLCAGCPHRGSFIAVKEAVREYLALDGARYRKAVYSGDIGCYTLGNAPPLDMVDTCLCMGAGITMAQGLNRVEPDTLNFAFIGDSTFFHTGIPGVINAVFNRANIIVVVLDNGATAMTGNQVHPGMGKTVRGEDTERVNIPALLQAAGVKEIRRANPFDFAEAKKAVAALLPGSGVRALIFEGPCIAAKAAVAKATWARKGTGSFVVDSAACTGCRVCVKKLGCPAISVESVPDSTDMALSSAETAELKAHRGTVRAVIDEALCTGCGLCAFFCAFGAIREGLS
ncbi:MAG: 4Fe-4S binding protein [Treponema sp.]|jgi:indolepyruvate ferredoxin oxidoreductase alpha subunit|nr:4Fe-4S binding protein [Treponema sp.]